MYCSNCGKKLEPVEKYCTNCGTPTFDHKDISSDSTPHITAYISPMPGFLTGILSFTFLRYPLISLPLAIFSIIFGVRYKKTTNRTNPGTVLGTISIIITTLLFTLTAFAFPFFAQLTQENIQEIPLNDENSFFFEEASTSFDIRGYRWAADDKTLLDLKKDSTYIWKNEQNQKFDSEGTYELYTGQEAISYISTNLKKFGITEEEQSKLFENGTYRLKDYYLIILKNDKPTETNTSTDPIYFYGFFKESASRLDLINMNTTSRISFTLQERLSSIDI